MAKVKVDREKCKGCLLCVSFCPKGVLVVEESLNRYGVKPVKFLSRASSEKNAKEGARCMGCAMCAMICPECCIEVYK